jgi:hypothetical protein
MTPWPEGGMILKFGSRASFSMYSASVSFGVASGVCSVGRLADWLRRQETEGGR